MPLVLTLGKGRDFYVGSERFVVAEIHSANQLTLRRTDDGSRLTILGSRSSEILPGVSVTLGHHSNRIAVRLVIDAPPQVRVLRGDKYRADPPETENTEMTSRDIQVSAEAVAQAHRLGLFGNVDKRIARMARKSSPFTHPLANRRYESFILKIEQDVVLSIMKFDPETEEVVTDVIGKLKS